MPRTYYWHIHHDVIAESTENIEERKDYVRCNKPIQQVEIRLRLMIPVKDQDAVGKAYEEYDATRDKAYEEYDATEGKARKEYDATEGKARKEYDAIWDKAYEEYDAIWDKAYEEYDATEGKAWKEYEATEGKAWKKYNVIRDKALKDYNASLWELHKKEHPDCPWNGKTIFPEEVQ